MKAKFAGKCVETGRRFEVGANVKWLGKGKGCVLIDDSPSPSPSRQGRHSVPDWDGNPFNEAGEPMMTATQYRQECQADDDYRD